MRIRTATLFERTFEDILSCGHKYYSRNTIKHLYTEYKKCRAILLDNPYYGQLETILEGFQLEYRRVFIKPYFKIVYTVDGEDVVLVDVWDVRQNPDALRNRIDVV